MRAEYASAVDEARQSLLAAINTGVFPEGSRLPGERKLAAHLSVSRETLRQALKLLAGEGRLQAAPQRGWFVRSGVIGDPPNVLRSFTDMARARGLRAGARVLSADTRAATLGEAEALAIAPTSQVFELARLRTLDGLPVEIDRSVVALSRAPGLERIDFTDQSLYGALESTCGVSVTRADFAVRADAATPEQAGLLGLAVGAPVLVGDELTYDFAEVPVLAASVVFRSDAYQFRATLYRSIGRSVV